METIKIPKVKGSTKLYVNKSDIEETFSGYWVTLKAQEVAGLQIPLGIRFFHKVLPGVTGMIVVDEKPMNDLLRMLYLNQLRNFKQ